MLESLPITSREIQKWTDRDPILSKEQVLLRNGWKHTSEEALKPYQQRHSELSLQDNCVLLRARVVIPPPGQERILNVNAPGICLLWLPSNPGNGLLVSGPVYMWTMPVP